MRMANVDMLGKGKLCKNSAVSCQNLRCSGNICWPGPFLENFTGDFPGGFFWALFPTDKSEEKESGEKLKKRYGGTMAKLRERFFPEGPKPTSSQLLHEFLGFYKHAHQSNTRHLNGGEGTSTPPTHFKEWGLVERVAVYKILVRGRSRFTFLPPRPCARWPGRRGERGPASTIAEEM